MKCGIDDCAKDGVENFLIKILSGIEGISQSNQSKFNVTRSIMIMVRSCCQTCPVPAYFEGLGLNDE